MPADRSPETIPRLLLRFLLLADYVVFCRPLTSLRCFKPCQVVVRSGANHVGIRVLFGRFLEHSEAMLLDPVHFDWIDRRGGGDHAARWIKGRPDFGQPRDVPMRIRAGDSGDDHLPHLPGCGTWGKHYAGTASQRFPVRGSALKSAPRPCGAL